VKRIRTPKPRTLRRRNTVFLGLAVVVLGLAGIVAYGYVRYVSVVRYTAQDGRVTISTGTVNGLGTVLVTNKGYALYVFAPDRASRVSCTGDCADGWPPLVVPDGDSLSAGDGVRADLLGTILAPGGKRVVTYRGWPLYTYLGDAGPGHAAGQGKDDDGGYWYVMQPSGQIVGGQPILGRL
jgi:predicted lipoprotein with Yx(FWY)xxD motif